jgi:hypothetical protein
LQFAQANAQTKNCKRASTFATQRRISKFSPTLLKKIKTRNRTDRHKMTVKLNNVNGLQTQWTRTPAGNRRLAQWRVKWLIEHSTSHQLLWCIDSFALRIPPLRQAPKR